MAVDLEADWLARKAVVYEDIAALLSVGIPIATAKRVAGWNPTLGYATFADMQSGLGDPSVALRDALRLMVSRSESRANPGQLVGAQLDAGVNYAIFIPDIPELGIDQIQFYLDGSPVHLEASTPWDYDGTNFDGSASRVTFTPGEYTIAASVTDSNGVFSIDATFNVE